jgi:hypothetical protein
VIGWSDEEKDVLMSSATSKEAIEKYFKKFPRSNRTKSSLYTYWWWRKQEEKKKGVTKPAEEIKKVKKDLTEEFGKDTDKLVATPTKNTVRARIVESFEKLSFEPGDSVRYTRGSLILSPIGIVIDASKKKGIPEKSQKMKVRFDNYNVREVYCCDYTIVMKGRKG